MSKVRLEDYYHRRLPYSVRSSARTQVTAVYTTSPTPEGSSHDVFSLGENGSCRRLTHVGQSMHPRWRPNHDHLGVVSRRPTDPALTGHPNSRGDADEQTSVWVYDFADGGDARQLTVTPEPVIGFDWSPSGDRVVVESRRTPDEKSSTSGRLPPERRPRRRSTEDDADTRTLWIVDAESGESRRLEGAWSHSTYFRNWYHDMKPVWGTDSRIGFVAQQHDSTGCFDIHSIRPDGSDHRVHTDGTHLCTNPVWSPDGDRLAYIRHHPAAEHVSSEASFVDISRNERRVLSDELDRDVHFVDWLNQTTLVGNVTDEGKGVFYRFGTDGDISLYYEPEWPHSIQWSGKHRPFDVDRERGCLDFGLLSPTASSIATVELSNDGVVRDERRTRHAFNADQFAHVDIGIERLSISREDDPDLDGFLYHPPRYEEATEDSVPVILDIHRDLHGVTVPRFRFRTLYWASIGYAVLKLNFRGSKSYGEQFAREGQSRYHDADVSDLAAGIEATLEAQQPDPANVFGVGYLHGAGSLIRLAAETDLLAGVVAKHGIYDYTAVFTRDDRNPQWEARLGTPWDDADAYSAASPLTEARQVTTPVLLVAGGEDERSPQEQSERLYEWLSATETDVSLHTYPKLGSSAYAPPDTTIARLERTTEWLARHSSVPIEERQG